MGLTDWKFRFRYCAIYTKHLVSDIGGIMHIATRQHRFIGFLKFWRLPLNIVYIDMGIRLYGVFLCIPVWLCVF